MKILKKLSCCLFALGISFLILYANILFSFPSQIIMYKGEMHNSSLGVGVSISDIPENVCASTSKENITPLKMGEYEASLKIGNKIPFRKINLKIITPKSVYASGELVGLRIHNKGLIVTDTAPVTSGENEISPAQKAGIVAGDIIMEINGHVPKSGDDVAAHLSENTTLTLMRNSSLRTIIVNPVRDDSDGAFKLGVWVRDSTAGVGTMTYFDAETNTYGALGHGISDSDTGIMFTVQSGTVEKSRVVSVKKGERGTPGEICGSFSYEANVSGTVSKNCEAGIFGNIFSDSPIRGASYPVGAISQVETGKAKILSTVDDDIKEYEIAILRCMPFGSATKGLAIKITDPNLLSKTGGIVQGMSGSPIIQNGRLIGAVTHVLVNDPTRGYGIFIENMLAEAQ